MKKCCKYWKAFVEEYDDTPEKYIYCPRCGSSLRKDEKPYVPFGYCECGRPRFVCDLGKDCKPKPKIEELEESGLSYKKQDIELVSKINELVRHINGEGA